jgi:hypothetical protein
MYLTELARLGGYLAHAKDPPPGNTVTWRGMTRLIDSNLAASLELNLWVIESITERLRTGGTPAVLQECNILTGLVWEDGPRPHEAAP